jgi:hypothetical protein
MPRARMGRRAPSPPPPSNSTPDDPKTSDPKTSDSAAGTRQRILSGIGATLHTRARSGLTFMAPGQFSTRVGFFLGRGFGNNFDFPFLTDRPVRASSTRAATAPRRPGSPPPPPTRQAQLGQPLPRPARQLGRRLAGRGSHGAPPAARPQGGGMGAERHAHRVRDMPGAQPLRPHAAGASRGRARGLACAWWRGPAGPACSCPSRHELNVCTARVFSQIEFGGTCHISGRPYTVFRWRPGAEARCARRCATGVGSCRACSSRDAGRASCEHTPRCVS